MDYTYIDKNVAAVREKIAAAEKKSGKSALMVAAVKYADKDEIARLCECGACELGENRVQQLLEHYEALADKNANWHFIGTLQTNKVKYIVDKVCLIHSVDSERLAYEIDRQSAKRGVRMRVLVEINSGAEESKSGVLAEDAEALCRYIGTLENTELCGFMTMAPRCESADEYKRYFLATKNEAYRIWHDLGRTDEPLLSMGMSESFEAAIECGADIVRVGRSLFAK